MSIAVETITFGIEIETIMPDNYRAGGYHNGIQAEGLPRGWKAERDSSIRAPYGHRGCEFVSPILHGVSGIREAIEVVAQIKAMGGSVNSSCGLHIHVGFDRNKTAALKRLVTLTANFEKAIYASTGIATRETGNYSRSIHQYGNHENAERISGMDRFHGLNLTNLKHGRRAAVEFRFFAGTLNANKIVAHIRQVIGLVERAYTAKRVSAWTAKQPKASSPIARSGEGQTHLTRLFYQLGWIKGRQPHIHGNLVGDGIPTLADSKKTLMRLARKYDARS